MLERIGLNKLEGFGPLYVINLKRSSDRKEYITQHFSKYGISDYTFISAVDGENDDIDSLLINPSNSLISKKETACSISHLRAISQWLDESDSEYAIIAEDDVSLETVDFWSFTWQDFLNSINKKYDVLQLAIINNYTVNPRLHLREILDWSSAIYLIKRDYAKKIIKKHVIQDKYFFEPIRLKSLADCMLYTNGLCYSIPLFTYSLDLGSNINPSHINTIHFNSKSQVLAYWQNNSMFKLDLT